MPIGYKLLLNQEAKQNMFNFLTKKSNTLSYHYSNQTTLYHLYKNLSNFIYELNPDNERSLVFLCIGTDRSTGDSLGPLVGTHLQSMSSRTNIFGTLSDPVHAVNLNDKLQHINELFKNPLIIAIDASLGKSSQIGYINLRQGSLKPGAGINKDLPAVGDCAITGVVNSGGCLEHLVLQNTRLAIVYGMSKIIARSIFLTCNYLKTKKVM